MSAWICVDETPRHTTLYRFSARLDAAPGDTLTARVSGDTRYLLYVNGRVACEGPCQSTGDVWYYETVDLTPFLTPGENRVEARVLYAGEGEFLSLSRHRRPGFWLDGTYTHGGVESPWGTDASWTCVREESVTFHQSDLMHPTVAPMEEHTATGACTGRPVQVLFHPDPAGAGYDVWGCEAAYVLRPRPLPPLARGEEISLLSHVVRRGEDFVELDAGAYVKGRVRVRLAAPVGQRVQILYSECYSLPTADGGWYKARRDDATASGATLLGPVDVLHGIDVPCEMTTFWYRAFRYVRIFWDAAVGAPELLDVTVTPVGYPTEVTPVIDGAFSCSDPVYDDLWRISRATVKACMHETFMDCPHYEQLQYGLDGYLEAAFAARLWQDTRLTRKCILDLAASQRADGMLRAQYPSGLHQVIPGYTLFWILLLSDYVRQEGVTEDTRALLYDHLGTMDKALSAFYPYMTPEGLIGPSPFCLYVDWIPTWPMGAPVGGQEEPICATCFLYAVALAEAAHLCRALSLEARAQEYEGRAKTMRKAIDRAFYDARVGLYRDVPSREAYSLHGAAWAVLSGARQGQEAVALMTRAMDAYLGRPHVGETPVTVDGSTFSMSYFLFRALEMTDLYDTYAPCLLQAWKDMRALHCTTWCENLPDPRSECHGFSAVPAFEASAVLLGVTPATDGYGEVRIRPHVGFDGLTSAKGRVPTPHGPVGVSWHRTEGTWHLEIDLPTRDGVPLPATVILPDGRTLPVRGQGTWTTAWRADERL